MKALNGRRACTSQASAALLISRQDAAIARWADDGGAPLPTGNAPGGRWPHNTQTAAPRLPAQAVGALPTAIIYCEGHFGLADGKTANGLVRHSGRFTILSVIDSRWAGRDAGVVLGGAAAGIGIYANLREALEHAAVLPEYIIIGMAPASGMLAPRDRRVILQAMAHGLNVVNGLHQFLNDDDEFVAMTTAERVQILDVRRPRAAQDLRTFSGRIAGVTCPRIAVLGTDCAIGKRTTATILTEALTKRGLKAVMIATGQTGVIQGARYCVALDAVPSQFAAGEMEAAVLEAFAGENPDVIVVEGQGSLSHPAYSTSASILRGSCPDAVILQHAPGRTHRCDFESMVMPSVAKEVGLIEAFAETRVIGLTLNHEGMTDGEVSAAIVGYERNLGIPTTDALARPTDRLVDMVLQAFPKLANAMTRRPQ